MKRFFSLCLAAALFAVPVSYASAQSAQEIMNQFNHEPSVEATMDAAVEYAGLSKDRLEGLYKRAGGANALPMKLSYEFQTRDRDTDKPQHVYTYGAEGSETYDSDKFTKTHEDQVYTQHKVQAQWNLSKLVYNSEQKGVASLMTSASIRRDKLLKDVTKVYFARRKLQIDGVMNPPTDIASKLDSDLKIQELTANLDAMTGGWFSAQIRGGKR